jgi:hypothetical protein
MSAWCPAWQQSGWQSWSKLVAGALPGPRVSHYAHRQEQPPLGGRQASVRDPDGCRRRARPQAAPCLAWGSPAAPLADPRDANECPDGLVPDPPASAQPPQGARTGLLSLRLLERLPERLPAERLQQAVAIQPRQEQPAARHPAATSRRPAAAASTRQSGTASAPATLAGCAAMPARAGTTPVPGGPRPPGRMRSTAAMLP